MNNLWLTNQTAETVAWSLIHFLWEGAALALCLYVFVAFTRSAKVRYGAGVLTLIFMSAAPLVTFRVLAGHQQQAASAALREAFCDLTAVASKGVGWTLPSGTAAHSLMTLPWMQILFWGWLAGVSVFSLRALGGFLVLRRVLREKREPIAADLRILCNKLQERVGVSSAIRYFQCRSIDAPAVAGWFKPVILIPFSALSGLTPQQLEAVIAHELAHIRRFDSFVNLFQIAAETVLFYHPAVWWVSRMIRNERENCCDDVAVEVCGDPAAYARALTTLESARRMPALVLAATSGSLRARIGRVLGMEKALRGVPQSGLALIGSLCIAGAVLGAGRLEQALAPSPNLSPVVYSQSAPLAPHEVTSALAVAPAALAALSPQSSSQAPAIAPVPAPKKPSVTVTVPAPAAPPLTAIAVEPDTDDEKAEAPEPAEPPEADENKAQVPDGKSGNSYIDGMRSAGVGKLSVDDLIALKVQGVTPEYAQAMRAAGFTGPVHELIAMKIQGVTADFIKGVMQSGLKDVSMGEILAMKVQGLDPQEAARLRTELGLGDVSLHKLIAFKVMGVTPEYVRAMKSAGLADFSPNQLLAAKAQGITPEFVEKLHKQGFNNLTMRQLIGLKASGVF